MMARDRIHGTILLTPITPIHIGNGNILTNLDYAIRKGRYEVKDVQRFFADHKDDIPYALDAIENGLDIGPQYVRYTLPYHGTPPNPHMPAGPHGGGSGAKSYKDPRNDAPFNAPFAALKGSPTPPEPAPSKPVAVKQAKPAAKPADPGQTVGDVREFIKDPFGSPFLPGSSVKGSLRTAIAWELSKGQSFQEQLGNTRRERVDPPIMNLLFGDKPHVDLLKALHIGDSAPLACEESTFAMCQVIVMNQFNKNFEAKRGVPIHVEALMPSAGTVRIPIRVDLFRLSIDPDLKRAAAGKGVDLLKDKKALTDAVAAYSKELLEYEKNFYDRRAPQVAQFIQGLLRAETAVLPLGFGTGWHAKTIGRRLAPNKLKSLRDAFCGRGRDGKPLKNMGTPGVDLFPKTRKWAQTPSGPRPMGWCKVEIVWE